MGDQQINYSGSFNSGGGGMQFGAGASYQQAPAPILAMAEVQHLQAQLEELRGMLQQRLSHDPAERLVLEGAIAQTRAAEAGLAADQPHRNRVQALIASIAVSVKDLDGISAFVQNIVHVFTGPS